MIVRSDMLLDVLGGVSFLSAMVFALISNSLLVNVFRCFGPIKIFIAQPLTNHSGAIQSFDLRPIHRDCQVGGTLCNSLKVPSCSEECVFTTNPSDRSDSIAHILQPDEAYHLEPSKKAAFRVIFGHEPYYRTPDAYFNDTFISLFNVAAHWGTNADIPLNFFYFDKYFGRLENNWWKKPQFGRSSFNLSSFSYNKSRGGVSLIYSNGYSKARNTFVYIWKKKVPTRSFGSFEFNSAFTVPLNETDPYGRQMQKMEEISHFPFHIVVESTQNESGWVTEKVFEAFAAGTVPIYWGPQDVFRYVPENSIIFVSQSNISQTAALVNRLLENDTEYMAYHHWRLQPQSSELFSRLIQNGRTTAACRLCSFIHRKLFEEDIPASLTLSSLGWSHKKSII